MRLLLILSCLVKAFMILFLSCLTKAAPTHHLTIGVQGNTPTLIVTSSEIGITPETVDLPKKIHKIVYKDKSINKDFKVSEMKIKLNKNRFQNDRKEKHFKSNEKEDKITKPLGQKMAYYVLRNKDFKTTTTAALVDKITTRNTLKMPNSIKQKSLETNTPTLLPLHSETTTNNPFNSQEINVSSTTKDYTGAPDLASESKALKQLKIQTNEDILNYNKNNDVVNRTLLQTRKNSADIKDVLITREENNDNDSLTQYPAVRTENENLLLATIETKAVSHITTSTPTTFLPSANIANTADSLISTQNTNVETKSVKQQILSLSLLKAMTETEIIADKEKNNKNNNDNKSVQSKTEDAAVTHRLKVKDNGEKSHNGKTVTIKSAVSVKYSRQDGEFKPDITKEQEPFTTTLQTLNQFFDTSTQSTEIEDNASESLLATRKDLDMRSQDTGAAVSPSTKTFTEITEIENQPPITTLATISEDHGTTLIAPFKEESSSETLIPTKETFAATDLAPHDTQSTDNSKSSSEFNFPVTVPETSTMSSQSTTTEQILKLIDLEQHVLKSIDDLKQSSLLIAEQHDNGHDGLKNIKKKQLVDKHYVEALLHNKQDNHKTMDVVSDMSPSTTMKPVLMPIKHGYLGPIIMEEKTFHIIHHKDKEEAKKHLHKTKDIETQLRQGHFVELKVKAEESLATEGTVTPSVVTEVAIIASTTETKLMQETETQAATENQSTESAPSTLPYVTQVSIGNTSSLVVDPVMPEISLPFITTKKVPFEEPESNDTNKNMNSQTLSTIFSKQNISSLKASPQQKTTVLSTTVFQVMDTMATKMPMVQANTMFTSEDKEGNQQIPSKESKQTESKISDIQIEVYDSTVDSVAASKNFKNSEKSHDESFLGKTTKPPIASVQQERFTQYVIDRTETSTQEPINYSTIQVASGKPEPAAIEIHINVSESFGNENEELDFSYPQTEFNNNNNEKLAIADESYDESKVNENIKLKIPSNGGNTNNNNIDSGNDEILVVEIIDTENMTDTSLPNGKSKTVEEIFITDVKDHYTTPPPPPPPPPYQTNFDRDSDTIFYISNTEVKVGESLPNTKKSNEERKLKLESQFFPVNYIASTHPNINRQEEAQHGPVAHHLYEEDIILSSSRNQQDSLKIYRNRNEPSPPLDVTYVGESIIEVEQSPDAVITTTFAPEQQQQQQHQTLGVTTQADVIIQPAILPEISIGVPVIGELPPQIELKEIDFMPNEAQLHRSGMYDDNDNSNINSNDIDDNNHDGSNSNLHVDESSIQYGGDLIDESADGGFDGVEGSYPFGNPAITSKSYTSSYLTKLRKQQQKQQNQQRKPNHIADYAHLYTNYGVNNMRKDELSADIKDSAEMFSITGVDNGGSSGSGGGGGGISNEQNLTTFKDFLSKVSLSNSSQAYLNANSTTQSERMSNATAFSVMEDANDLEDKNTEDIINLISLAIGLFIVILPVVVTCSMFWALRYLYKKYHTNITENGGYAGQTETKVPLSDDGLEKGEDISRVARETKMDYNKDGVFVVEVARGIDSKTVPGSPVTDGGEQMLSMFDTKQNNGGIAAYKMANEKNFVNNEKVQIHSPPQENTEDGPRSLDQIEEVEEPINSPHLNDNKAIVGDKADVGLAYKCNTGLSQSDLSSTSSNDSNKDYCYGNQALYVVDENGYSKISPTDNVILKCDIKDIKDDDRNPGNDHYLKHSPNKKEEGKDKEDMLEKTENMNESGTRTSSGESPAQRPSDKGQEIKEVINRVENSQEVEKEEEILKDTLEDTQKIPVEIEVHAAADIIKDQAETNECLVIEVVVENKDIHEDTVCAESNTDAVNECIVAAEEGKTIKVVKNEEASEDTEYPEFKTEDNTMPTDTNDITNDVMSQEIQDAVAKEEDSALDIEKPIQANDRGLLNEDEGIQDVLAEELKEPTLKGELKNTILKENLAVFTVPESFCDHNENGSKLNPSNILEENDETPNSSYEVKNLDLNGLNDEKCNGLSEVEDSEINKTKIENNSKEALHTNGLKETRKEITLTDKNSLIDVSSIIPDIVKESRSDCLQNGHNNGFLPDVENGYDSLQSLPAPPPTTDELQLSNDLSDQQMDSLPPPPPPEIFCLKDLPPPTLILNNGCNADSPQSEESTKNFYNTLPPPPPITLEISAAAPGTTTTATTNGKLHASPLTPPASPPAHFTNNLHVGLCSQPIAVDVNGS